MLDTNLETTLSILLLIIKTTPLSIFINDIETTPLSIFINNRNYFRYQ